MSGRPATAAAVALLLSVAAVAVAGGAAVTPAAAQDAGIRATPSTAAIGEQLTLSAPGVDADAYEWDLGDGTEPIARSSSTITHEYLDPGTYTVTLRASTDGETTTYRTTVTVDSAFADVVQAAPDTEIETSGASGTVDVDVYAVEVPAGHHFGVSGSNYALGPSDPNGLRVFDADTDLVARTTLTADSVVVGTTAPADGETYYVAAQQGDALRSLSVSVTPPDEFEPNQNRTTAERVAAGAVRSGVVSTTDRVDWFAVRAGSGTVEATVELDGSAVNQPNVAVGIYDRNGTRIGELGPDASTGNRTAANGADADYTAVQRADATNAGIYYVRVRAVSGTAPFDQGFDTAPRPYTVTVDAPPPGPPAIGGDRPTDPDGDGRYEDVNGDTRIDVVDVQLLFASLDAPAVRDDPEAFDFNDDGTVDVVDVQALFAETGTA
jgi:PKD repeat protein